MEKAHYINLVYPPASVIFPTGTEISRKGQDSQKGSLLRPIHNIWYFTATVEQYTCMKKKYLPIWSYFDTV